MTAFEPIATIPEAVIPFPHEHTQRTDRRFIVDQPAQISVAGMPGEVWEARIRDISRSGMQFTVCRQMPAASQVTITWNGRDVFGVIRYQKPQGSEYRVGIELLSSWESLVTDILARQAEQLQEAEAALMKTNEDLAAALEVSREASRAKSRFLASVSHELRTPLNGIIGFSQLLHDGAIGPVTGDQQACLMDVLKCSEHLLGLVNHVLDLTTIEAGKMEFQYQDVSLSEVAGSAIDSIAPLRTAKQIRVHLTVDDRIGIVQADPSRLRQVLLNYLSNALKFTPAGGYVAVDISLENEHCYRITVTDNGEGISSDDLPRLFSEFGQLGPKDRAKEGTGLGLAITKRIVEAQGGRVGVESMLGQGARFYAVLPGLV